SASSVRARCPWPSAGPRRRRRKRPSAPRRPGGWCRPGTPTPGGTRACGDRRRTLGAGHHPFVLLAELEVDCLRSLAARIGLGFERHPGAVLQRGKAGAFDRLYVDEDVLAAVIRRDKAETARVVEKLDDTILPHGAGSLR